MTVIYSLLGRQISFLYLCQEHLTLDIYECLYTMLMPVMCLVTVTNIFIWQPYFFLHIYDHLYILWLKNILPGITFCVYACIYVWMWMCVHMHTCMYVCMYVCVHACMYVWWKLCRILYVWLQIWHVTCQRCWSFSPKILIISTSCKVWINTEFLWINAWPCREPYG